MRAGILSDVCARPTHSYECTLCKHVQIYRDQDLLMTIIIRGGGGVRIPTTYASSDLITFIWSRGRSDYKKKAKKKQSAI